MSFSIPAFHVSDTSKATGGAEVFIASRHDAASSGIFKLEISVQFNPPADDYPSGNVRLGIDLSDGAKGTVSSTSIELINSNGKHNPTVYLTGRCAGDLNFGPGVAPPKGLRFWLMIADNKGGASVPGTPDVVSFSIHDSLGKRIAYGTGPVRAGDVVVAPK